MSFWQTINVLGEVLYRMIMFRLYVLWEFSLFLYVLKLQFIRAPLNCILYPPISGGGLTAESSAAFFMRPPTLKNAPAAATKIHDDAAALIQRNKICKP